MKLKQSSAVQGDETASYSVELEKQYTVNDLINEVLDKSGEWGYIGISYPNTIFGHPKCEYKGGKLITNLPEKYLSKKIISAKANGGWSRMDYLLVVE